MELKTEPEDSFDDLYRNESSLDGSAVVKCETVLDEDIDDFHDLEHFLSKGSSGATKGAKRFQCAVCRKAYVSAANYKNHMRLHTGEDVIRCAKCSRVFSQDFCYKKHKCLFSEDERVECASCGKECKISVEKLVDVKTGKVVHYKCENCEESPLRGDSSRSPDPSKEVRIKCKDCSSVFRSENNFLAHVKLHRADRRVPRCEICSKVFPSFSKMRRHHTSHSADRKFPCDACKKVFKYRTNLQRHVVIHSSEEGAHKCTLCSKTFAQPFELKRHLLSHSSERQFKCELCSKTFKYQQNLNSHLKYHTREGKLHVCTKCDKFFPHSHELKRHLLSHERVKQFKCDLCEKPFKYLSNLKTHVKRHLGGKGKPVAKVCVKQEVEEDEYGPKGAE